ncbi:MAG: DNA-protecting protein DprA [Candidatus Eremiobacteraeota bacterium]|nr:DNA-protecting protein DprA [Candidatus Eremiobacteraeota bacterium]
MDDLHLGYVLAVAEAGVYAPRAVRAWSAAHGSARALVDALRGWNDRVGTLDAHAALEPLSVQTRTRIAAIDDGIAGQALAAARASGARIVLDGDDDYPAALRQLCDAPLVLYARGDLACLQRRCLAIVGSRAASAYGRGVAASIAADAGACSATVISGLARGIDAAAHRGALDAGVPTAAVLGSGVCALYPQYHALLADEIVERGGAVLSEFSPTQSARAFHFPLRNRIVAALADATVVVEAGERSGAWITARLADELGRHVFAIPGDVSRPTSRGTNALIADGVTLVTSAADICALLRWEPSIRAAANRADEHASNAGHADALLAALGQPQTIDQLAEACRCGVAEIAARLMIFELQGIVQRGPGGAYSLVRAAFTAKRGS